MSMLPPDVHNELGQLLQALQSPDNSTRSQAEDHLQNNWTASRPELLLMGLAEQIGAASNDTAVSLPRPRLSSSFLHPPVQPRHVLTDCPSR